MNLTEAETINPGTQLRITPNSQQQQRFIDSIAREQLFGGAKRGGKTVAGCMKALLLSILIPGNRGLIARQHWPELRDSTLETFWQVCPPEAILEWKATDKIAVIRSIDPQHPSKILFRALGDARDFEKTKGLEVGWFWVDEPTEVPEQNYLMLRAQLCWVLPGKNGARPPYMALLTSNPEPGWVKRRFIDSMVEGGEFIPALPRDNPDLPPGWEHELRNSMDAEWVEKYLNGSWNVGEGSVFQELDTGRHSIEDMDHSGLKLISSIDHATTGVTACLQIGIDADENVFVLGEYYQRNRLISEHAREIRKMLAGYGKQEYTLIDPSTEAKTLQGPHELYSVQDEYRRNGLHTVAGFRQNIDVGINLIKEYLHVNPGHRHPQKLELGAPRLYIVKRKCPNLWREMAELTKKLSAAGNIEFLGDDHAVDNLRYILMSRPKAPKHQQLDLRNLPVQQRFAITTHSNWARRWDRKTKDRGSWW